MVKIPSINTPVIFVNENKTSLVSIVQKTYTTGHVDLLDSVGRLHFLVPPKNLGLGADNNQHYYK